MPHQHVDQHRLLLLEGAGHHQAGVVALDRERSDLLRRLSLDTAHSPSPRMTWKGSLRCQSMKWLMFSRVNSIGRASSRTSSSKRVLPDALGEGVELLAVLALGLVHAQPALDRVRHALGRQAHLQPGAVEHLAALVVAADVGDVGRDRVLADLDRRAVEPDVRDVVLAAAVRAAGHLDVDPPRERVVDAPSPRRARAPAWLRPIELVMPSLHESVPGQLTTSLISSAPASPSPSSPSARQTS